MKKFSSKMIERLVQKMDKSLPVIILTPIDRYLGFSAPISPVEQFKVAAEKWNIPILFKDPQKLLINMDKSTSPTLYDENGEVAGSAYFAFGHEPLDRNMVRFIITALESQGVPVVNGDKALTVADDKGLMALAFAGRSDIPTAQSVIASARGPASKVLELLDDSQVLITKMTGFTGGGVGTQPMEADIDYLAPSLWLSRMDSRPRVVQNDADKTSRDGTRTVIRAYIVGGELIGCYTTEGYGLVNSAGLARESEGKPYRATQEQERVFLAAAEAVGASGYCRIDAAGGDNFCIYEVNPLARIDAEKYSLNIPEAILLHMLQLATNDKDNI
jgi:hypothetical protein